MFGTSVNIKHRLILLMSPARLDYSHLTIHFPVIIHYTIAENKLLMKVV